MAAIVTAFNTGVQNAKSSPKAKKDPTEILTPKAIIQEVLAECEARSVYHRELAAHFKDTVPSCDEPNMPAYVVEGMLVFVGNTRGRQCSAKETQDFLHKRCQEKHEFYENIIGVFKSNTENNIDIICHLLDMQMLVAEHDESLGKHKKIKFSKNEKNFASERAFLQRIKKKLEKAASSEYLKFKASVYYKIESLPHGFRGKLCVCLPKKLDKLNALQIKLTTYFNQEGQPPLFYRCNNPLILQCNQKYEERLRNIDEPLQVYQQQAQKEDSDTFEKQTLSIKMARKIFGAIFDHQRYLEKLMRDAEYTGKCVEKIQAMVAEYEAIDKKILDRLNFLEKLRIVCEREKNKLPNMQEQNFVQNIVLLYECCEERRAELKALRDKAQIWYGDYSVDRHDDAVIVMSLVIEESTLCLSACDGLICKMDKVMSEIRAEHDKKVTQEAAEERKQQEDMAANLLQEKKAREEKLRIFREEQAAKKAKREAVKKALLIAQAKPSKTDEVDEKQEDEVAKMKEHARHAFMALNPENKTLVGKILSKPTPHYKIKYKKVVGLIAALGGCVDSANGSHRKVTLFSSYGYFDFENSEKTETAVTSVVEPHKKGVQKGTLAGKDIANIASLFERLGIKVELLNVPSIVTKPAP